MINIPEIVKQDCERRVDMIPHKSNWASGLGDPCLRRLVYWRTQWDKVQPHSGWLQGRFDTGNVIEDLTVNYINKLGSTYDPKFRLVEKGFHLNDEILDKYNIGGKPDTVLQVDGTLLGPVEVKSLNPNVFAQIHNLQSMMRYRWMAKYIPQLNIYEFGMNFETGWFCFVNTNNLKDIKWIELPLDYGLVERLLDKAETVNMYVESKELPDKLNLHEECSGCPFESTCCPEYTTPGNLEIIENEQLEGVLDRLEELKPQGEEIEELEKARDAMLNKGYNIVCGNWMVMWKKSIVNVKAQKAYSYDMWRKKIIKTEATK